MWAFMLYGKLFIRRSDYQLGHPNAVFAPARPYRPSAKGLHRRCKDGRGPDILEIPFSVSPVLRIPFYSTLLRRLGPRVFSLLIRTYGRRQPVLHALFHLIEMADFGETSLGGAFQRMPSLAVSLPERQRFVSHAAEVLASRGEAITLRELSESVLEDLRGSAR
jgi:hypothetical protein